MQNCISRAKAHKCSRLAENPPQIPSQTSVSSRAQSSSSYRLLANPLRRRIPIPEPDEVEEEIVLVESNIPHVVQDDKDPFILERVNVPAPPPPTPPAKRTRPSGNVYQTLNRRARPSLHRAVFIRNVQHAVIAREEEREEKEG
ncbi:hypothetical protein K503DRAFT_870378 [Rhizopogon vinicolor AM-OR11-026]|uniref:Uncharacterized protein n=1 Tax=Rhizopogon vinicolor AM-OR11-026 TaxID=1314800 RepID=A0A1B7MHF3_9AGAM|nr:hypothetical protein K503DRAFT_870378 [Rhizopogon vinicolor AM-OR11-026]